MFVNFKPLAKCGMEELAAHVRSAAPSGAVLFARKEDGEQKSAARQLILDIFHPDKWPGHLTMLTMPGLQWRFERKLLGAREPGWMRKRAPSRTRFISVENDRALYFASVSEMPGLHTPGSSLKRIKDFPFSEMGVKTMYGGHFFANIDDFMTYDWSEHNRLRGYHTAGWDAAWLDYTGPMTTERLAIIADFSKLIRRVLIVTSLKARFDKKTMAAILKAGGHSAWLRQHLGGEVLHDIEYFDTSPMIQFAVSTG